MQLLHKWWGKVTSFGYQLGIANKPWKEVFDSPPERNTLIFTLKVLGTLEAIKYELENDHLSNFSQLIKAETFVDLLEQAEHLFENGYYIASGIIGRAVLEEHLRNLCDINNCVPEKNKPTLNDFNQSLYKKEYYTKTRMKQIDALASIGNDAAHIKPELNATDVKKLLSDLPGIIEQTS